MWKRPFLTPPIARQFGRIYGVVDAASGTAKLQAASAVQEFFCQAASWTNFKQALMRFYNKRFEDAFPQKICIISPDSPYFGFYSPI
jgi:hypothetical protein